MSNNGMSYSFGSGTLIRLRIVLDSILSSHRIQAASSD